MATFDLTSKATVGVDSNSVAVPPSRFQGFGMYMREAVLDIEKMVEDGQLTLEEARVHPKSNILLRTVGTERDIKIDIFPIQLQSRDVILLCSDGLWGEIPEDILESVINENMDLRKTAQLLVRESHLGGGKDNCTLIMIRMP